MPDDPIERPDAGGGPATDGIAQRITPPRAPNRLQAHTAERILDHIRRDRLVVGTRLREEALVQRLGVSRTPIRAALRLLSEQGILVARPKQGYVLALDGEKIAEVAELPLSADESLYMQLARDRVGNRLPPSVTETFLMRTYGASRNLVLAALARLSEEGLVGRGKGREWKFLEILNSPRGQAESYQVRLMLEPAAMLLPGFRIDRQELERSREQHMSLIGPNCHALPSHEVFHIDASFHELLASMSCNSFVVAIVRQHNRLRRLIEYKGYPNMARRRAWAVEHTAIIDALLEGSTETASALLTDHLRNAYLTIDHYRQPTPSL